MPYPGIRVTETQELGEFTIKVDNEEMIRLRNIGACTGKDVRATLEGMLQDAVGMARQIMEATHEDLAKEFLRLRDVQKDVDARKANQK